MTLSLNLDQTCWLTDPAQARSLGSITTSLDRIEKTFVSSLEWLLSSFHSSSLHHHPAERGLLHVIYPCKHLSKFSKLKILPCHPDSQVGLPGHKCLAVKPPKGLGQFGPPYCLPACAPAWRAQQDVPRHSWEASLRGISHSLLPHTPLIYHIPSPSWLWGKTTP